MKDLIIVNGNAGDEAQVRDKVGDGFRVSSVSLFDVNNMALSTVITIANTLDSMDAYSGGKSLRVAVCARDIAKKIEDELDYPGQIKVTVVREFRTTEIAK